MPIFCSETEPQNTKVCVLDASSYVGLWILKKLLNRGYTVHAALHNNEEAETRREIREMTSTTDKERLSVFVVDVLDYQSILTALNGCSALFYSLDDPRAYDEKTVEVEVRGAINVVEACAQTQSMEKLVFSSSLVTGIWREDIRSTKDVDERCWSDVDLCRKLKLWYALAKTLSEQAAWALAMDRMLNMVSINAALVIGPDIANQNAVSTKSYLRGADKMQENGVLASVDVCFLVDIHIRALEDPSTSGRYFCFNKVVKSEEDAIKLAESLVPLISIPSRCRPQESVVYMERLRNKKLQKLTEVVMKST
uniref:Bifunctional dihydroflavonol 4-reductase/flavanone 4-reductase n=1 Tax=Anthurium amnicola TaxID=1678845 RepID=A0A1D1Z9X5_9ARAE